MKFFNTVRGKTMIEIKNEKLVIDGYAIGTESEILAICNKAKKYDEIKSSFGGDLNE